MKFPNWFKVTWWLILILVSGYILCHRINEIINGNSNQTDTVIFLIFIALMLVPIFPEVDLLGIKLKQNTGNFSDLPAFAHYLEKDMAERSVYNLSYKIEFL